MFTTSHEKDQGAEIYDAFLNHCTQKDIFGYGFRIGSWDGEGEVVRKDDIASIVREFSSAAFMEDFWSCADLKDKPENVHKFDYVYPNWVPLIYNWGYEAVSNCMGECVFVDTSTTDYYVTFFTDEGPVKAGDLKTFLSNLTETIDSDYGEEKFDEDDED